MSLSPELSPRALITGVLIGGLLGICNTYMGLRIGWFDTGSLTAAIVGFAVLRALKQTPTRAEHNILQTVAAAIATVPSTAGLVGAIPALAAQGTVITLPALVGWGVSLGGWGILVALPLRRRLLDQEALPFPTGVATAELISSVAGNAQAAQRRGRVFLVAALAAAVVTWLRDGHPTLLPQDLAWPLTFFGLAPGIAALGFAVSPLSLGAGLMGGGRIGLSLLLGGLAARVLLVPVLLQTGFLAADADLANAWLVWPGLGLLMGSSLPALWAVLRALPEGVAALGQGERLGRGAVAAGTACVALGVAVAVSWGASPWAVLLGFAVSVPLIAVSTRAAGQTDIAPLAPLGQLTQLLASLLPGGGAASTLAAGAVPAGAGAQTANTFWTLKSGRLLGAPDGPQLGVQALGAALGALIGGAVYLLLVSRFVPGSEQLPAPWVGQWKAMAALLAQGGHALPAGAGVALVVGLGLGAGLSLLEERRRWPVPSPLAMGLGLLLPLPLAATLALGGVVAAVFDRRGADLGATLGLPLAAGLIAGESVTAVCAVVVAALSS